MNSDVLVKRILAELGGATVYLDGADCSFVVEVISNKFEGLGLLSRQRKVLDLFKAELQSGALHALSVVAKTPAEHASTLEVP